MGGVDLPPDLPDMSSYSRKSISWYWSATYEFSEYEIYKWQFGGGGISATWSGRYEFLQ